MGHAFALALVLALAVAGCGDDDAAAVEGPAVEAAPAATTAAEDDPVASAVAISTALEADPENAEQVLASHDMSIEEFEQLMMDIAADPELSERYEAAQGNE